MLRWVSLALVLASVVALPGDGARADEANFSPDCGTDNLLARKTPSSRQDARGNLALVTDGAVAPEGAQWDSPVALVFDTGAGSVTYDLGQPYPLTAFLVQADANDTYKIFGSLDGSPQSFKVLAEIDIVNGHGLRTRTATINSTPVRFLRIGEGMGDNFYSVSEFQAFCQAPTPFPPKLRIVDAPAARVAAQPWWKFGWWQNEVSARFEMALAAFGAALIGWGLWLAKKGTPELHKKLRDRLLIAVGILSFGAYWNFGSGHFGNYIHIWDTYHYYVGSKYFKELSYDRLYDCVAVADAEDPALRRRVELRKIMNLRTNFIGPTTDVLAHPERCKEHFTPERWNDFKRDLVFFRNRHGVKRWEEAQTDHGYNATPVWGIVGTTLANTGPATLRQITALLLLDPAFALGMMAMIWWAFGWRTLCVALLIFGTNFPSRFYWTGGAYLRWDWLFYLVGGVCLLKKDRPVLGGFFLAYSTLLRVFPGFLFVGPLMVLIQGYIRTRKLDRRYVLVFAGAALAVALLVPISLFTSGGIHGYRRFIQNSEKHQATPLTNYMGLRTIVAYAPSEAGHFLKNDKADDAWGVWKQAKLRTFHARFPIYLVLAIGFLVLVWFAVRGVDPWLAAALSAMTISIGPSELTCYYYSFLVAAALVYYARPEAAAILAAVTSATSFIDWAPTRYLPNAMPWANLKMPTWLDEQYMWMSVVTLLGFAWILYRIGFPQLAVAPAGSSATPPTDGGGDGAGGGEKAAAKTEEKKTRGKGGASRRRGNKKKAAPAGAGAA
ncbi:MAG TPA: hypothetical protein VH374_11485 [Polyangia bacterium]|jgi:hypothetical protein|nr:hypothetical protein [Polyangia bacterium]